MQRKHLQILLAILFTLVIGTGVYVFVSYLQTEQANAEAIRIAEEEHQRDLMRITVLSEAETLVSHYDVVGAITLLKQDETLINDAVTVKITEYETLLQSYVKYEGVIEHIFFHSLIIYPELAFDDIGHDKDGYNMWFTTVEEFKKILPLLDAQGFVLVRINDLFEMDDNGAMQRKDLYLPEGKKPLVISQDDVSYYEYMKGDGFATRLVLDENNEVATEVITPTGETVITRDGDMIPLLDDYVKEHPGFSYKGAKGVIAITGYEGVLGYRLDTEETAKAKEIADVMKANGWEFASHSYTHRSAYFKEEPDVEGLQYDLAAWQRNIEPLVGKTNIFISPFGAELDDEYIQYFTAYGFQFYCIVDRPATGYKNRGSYVLLPRFNIDGYTLTYDTKRIEARLFPTEGILDPARPKVKRS